MTSRLQILTFCFVFASACAPVLYHSSDTAPRWKRNVHQETKTSYKLTVVSYNIKYGLKVDEAIRELKTGKLEEAEVLLLQEMDENGVRLIAEALQMNYVYYPQIFNTKDMRNFGNAILSKYELFGERKHMLKHYGEKRRRRKGATSASINVNGKTLSIYAVHFETLSTSKKTRIKQIESFAAEIKSDSSEYILVGGDFNLMFKGYRTNVAKEMVDAGLIWQTENLGSTATALFGLSKPAHDHFFTKGLKGTDLGKIEHTKASDHLPIWIELELDN